MIIDAGYFCFLKKKAVIQLPHILVQDIAPIKKKTHLNSMIRYADTENKYNGRIDTIPNDVIQYFESVA
ncbi:hypothetical protein NV63_03480 [Elizabethkingia anophelis]|nr:hypothetical protein NV63_03480 [Elizabethkingia anophelis]